MDTKNIPLQKILIEKIDNGYLLKGISFDNLEIINFASSENDILNVLENIYPRLNTIEEILQASKETTKEEKTPEDNKIVVANDEGTLY